MTSVSLLPSFRPLPPDNAGVVSWAHLGDLHMTLAGEQNHLDLMRLVEEINAAFAGSLSFVFLPGDVADHGNAAEYEVVREALAPLRTPWCAIVGDHDVHERSLLNFEHYMSAMTHYRFRVGAVHFFALNAFEVPDPGSFTMLSDQLEWMEAEMRAVPAKAPVVVFLHCYPSELKQGGGRLQELVADPRVRVVEMGHTHYNEVANDGKTLYFATRSTGQIEEGPVGFSVTNVDGDSVSWKFFTLGALPAVMITSPADERFLLDGASRTQAGTLRVRAKVWSASPVRQVTAVLNGTRVPMQQVAGSQVWEAAFGGALADGSYALRVECVDDAGHTGVDEIRIRVGEVTEAAARAGRDRDNALDAWPERGLLGTQLGPNKNGRKW